MKSVVIGATGQLGHDILRIFGEEAIGLTHNDLDVTNFLAVKETFQALKPDWIFNTAAFHKVDDCEVDPALAFSVNALGALNVARAAASIGSGIVFFSTDYVFGGEDRERGYPYIETDRPYPVNIYGVSKWSGEQLVMQANPRHLVIRSTGLYGLVTSRKGWTFPELMLVKAQKDRIIRVVNDQALSPTFTVDLVQKMKELVEQEQLGLFHLTNMGECSWFEFAQEVFHLARVDVQVEAIDSQQIGQQARRPQYSALKSFRLSKLGIHPLRSWKEALSEYLHLKGVL